ncbi:MAG: AAA-like domain-containing protein [Victivallales bacterium]|nr:AAA-like domain-containing protein [Victivallales bacterium]
MRRFNIAGNCQEDKHYMLPPLPRIPQAWDLVQNEEYFVLHAPRQSGKTTALLALCDELNLQGKYHAVYCTLKKVPIDSECMEGIMDATNRIWLSSQQLLLERGLPDIRPDATLRTSTLQIYLTELCRKLDKPLVLLLDDVDALTGYSQISLLSQLRSGFASREDVPFPASVVLAGSRDISNYRLCLPPDSELLERVPPFNIIAAKLTLATFTPEQIAALYAQHTAETGQRFQDGALERVYHWTGGQPWLVNAVARECVEEICRNDFTREITPDLVDQAA